MLAELGITGIGMVTPLGESADATWRALLRSDSITTHTRLPVEASDTCSRVGRLATAAAREALNQAGWSDDDGLAIVLGTSKGPIESWITPAPPFTSDNAQTAGRCHFGLAATATELADQLGLGNVPRITLSAACTSGLHALIRGALMIRHGEARRVLVVAAEASVHALFLGSFERLGVLAPAGDRCRPFDQYRRGFLMSEAAAAICIEPVGPTPHSGPIARIGPFAMAADATNLVAADLKGAALRRLLERCSTDEPIDLYHAHGTGTVLNDAIELAAIEQTLSGQKPSHRPIVYSHKGAIGHSLGAAGLLSVAISVQCHRHGYIPGSVNTTAKMPTEQTIISPDPTPRQIRRSITCSTGFGGPLAAVYLIS